MSTFWICPLNILTFRSDKGDDNIGDFQAREQAGDASFKQGQWFTQRTTMVTERYMGKYVSTRRSLGAGEV